MVKSKPTVGVLALQGDVAEHNLALSASGAIPVEVKNSTQLGGLDGLIIPGGESTTMAKLLDTWGLRQPISDAVKGGMPLWGTCAGMIILSSQVEENSPIPLGLMDFTVRRNFFGRQVDSFEQDLTIDILGTPVFRAVFIRAPIPTRVGEQVQILARLADGTPVALLQNNCLATAFHPELTGDVRIHKLFVKLTRTYAKTAA